MRTKQKQIEEIKQLKEERNAVILLEKIKWSLEKMENKARVPEKIRIKAKIALDKMLEVL